MALVNTKVEAKYQRRTCQNGKDSQIDLHEGASRGSSEAGDGRRIKRSTLLLLGSGLAVRSTKGKE